MTRPVSFGHSADYSAGACWAGSLFFRRPPRRGRTALAGFSASAAGSYCEEQGWRVAGIFQDDGYTGLNMDRPDFQRMLGAVERGMFDVILTKDLSRLGRNYLQTGQLIEEFFPRNKVRYIVLDIAVNSVIECDIAH